jgi:single-stranded-DNA-specific exonuclease
MKKAVIVREQKGDTLLDHLLHHRGIASEEEKEKFLNPDYDTGLHDPSLLVDMAKAVERIEKAIGGNEKIVVYSDYDADGIPGAVAMAHFFRDIGYKNIEHYIPHRHEEGFGLHKGALDAIKKAGGQLVITIDCGISDIEEAKYAKDLGIDLIITDHHIPGSIEGKEILPDAVAVIDPKRSDCTYPEKMLCGAGVAFKLIQALLKRNRYGLKEGREKWLLDMIGIATLSDMVPLKGENRVFAKYGLMVLQKSPRPGLSNLLSNLNVNQKFITEDDVQFMITPRINVASRMGNPRDAFVLLSTSDFEEADRLVQSLNLLNDERKGSVAIIVKEIKKKVAERDLGEAPVIVLGNPGWRPALLGLVANTLVRDFGKPVFLWGRSATNDQLKGSFRSDGFIDTLSLIREIPEGILIECGGHSMSGGFSLNEENVHKFEPELIKAFDKLFKRNGGQETLPYQADRLMTIDDVNWINWKIIERLAPFGEGNPKPLFLFENEKLSDVRIFGKNKEHVEYIFVNGMDKPVGAVSFFGCAGNKCKKGDKISFLATFEKSMYRRYPELRLRMIEILE